MHMYNLDRVKLPTTDLQEKPFRPVKLTPADFDAKTLKMIHRFYAGDFGRFRYKRIKVPETATASAVLPPKETE